jgi:hypothetical protein
LFAEFEDVVLFWGGALQVPVLLVEVAEDEKGGQYLFQHECPVLCGFSFWVWGGVLMMVGSSATGFLYSLK